MCRSKTLSVGPDHLLLDRRGRARLGSVEVAVGRALEPVVFAGQMSRSLKGTSVAAPTEATDPGALDSSKTHAVVGATAPEPKASKRRRRNTAGFEERIGYRFKDPALLDQALTHIS